MHITFDIDGVLADFSAGFCGVLKDLYDLDLDPRACKSWHWADWADGLTQEMESNAWDAIFEEERYRDFWADLAPLCTMDEVARINRLDDQNIVSFITNRAASGQHDNVLLVTKAWLRAHGFTSDRVFLAGAGQKGRMARTLGAHMAIEDNGENCLDYLVNDIGVAMLHRAYNDAFVDMVKTRGGWVVETLAGFLDLVEDVAREQQRWIRGEVPAY